MKSSNKFHGVAPVTPAAVSWGPVAFTMQRLTFFLLICGFTLFLVSTAYAKVRYLSKAEMVNNAKIIAIVKIDKVEAVETRGAKWLYRQRAHATVERTVKGESWKELTFCGDEAFHEEHTQLSPGRFLVFLSQDTISVSQGKLLKWMAINVGANWGRSVRPMIGDKVEWYSDDWLSDKMSVPLQTVLVEIESIKAGSVR